jgi:hypothetical protein
MGNPIREAGIDTVKAVSIILVLIWHIQPITGPMPPPGGCAGSDIWPAVDFFYRYITLLAVPSFICVSLFLFAKKSLEDNSYWKRRLLRLIQLFVFWTGVQFIVYLLAGGKLPLPLGSAIPGGGPELPYVGGSVFYFLFVLIFCTVLTALFLKLSEAVKRFTAFAIIVLSTLHFALSPVYKFPIDTMAMENYYIFIPVAYYMARYQDRFVRGRIIFFIGYVLAIFYEEFFLNSFVSAYGRLSILFGALSLITFCLQIKSVMRPAAFLSKYSLGIFALHKYWLYLAIVIPAAVKIPEPSTSSGACAERLILFALVTVFTLLSVYLLGKTRLRFSIS